MEHKFLTEESILAEIKGSWAGKRVKVFSETDSTNTQCRKLAAEGWPEGTLVVSEYQRAGKGRRGRAWVSPAGTGIWMSLLLRPELPQIGRASCRERVLPPVFIWVVGV